MGLRNTSYLYLYSCYTYLMSKYTKYNAFNFDKNEIYFQDLQLVGNITLSVLPPITSVFHTILILILEKRLPINIIHTSMAQNMKTMCLGITCMTKMCHVQFAYQIWQIIFSWYQENLFVSMVGKRNITGV